METQNKIDNLWKRLESPNTFLIKMGGDVLEAETVLDVVKIRGIVNELNTLYRWIDTDGYGLFVDADTIIDSIRKLRAKEGK